MKIKKKNKPSTEIPASSMSDIAFLLIIFFMLTTVFSQEQGLKYQLPDSTKEVSLDSKNIEIIVDENFNVTFDGMPIPSDQLDQIRVNVQARKLIKKDIFVIIKVAPRAPYKYLIDIIDEILLGGVDNIAFQSTDESMEDFNFEKDMSNPQ
ncbi:biopolymer transporter ExbD [bacterium]|nr:biopolymer transporter ExbD [bacterium]